LGSFLWYNKRKKGVLCMNSITEFKELVEEFSLRVHQQFFSHIPSYNWSTTSSHGSNYVYFGFEPHDSWRHNNIVFCLTYDQNNQIISFDVQRKQPKDETAIEQTKQAFIAFFREKNIRGFLRSIRCFSIDNLIPLHTEYAGLLEIMNVLIDQKKTYYSFSIYQAKHLHYHFQLDIQNMCIRVLIGNEAAGTISSKEEALLFHQRIEDEVEQMKKAEEKIIAAIEQFDKTFYYTNQEFYLFNERVSFQIHKTFQNGKERFRSRFGTSYNQNLKLEKLAEIVEKKALTLLKKKRVKAVLSGKTIDVFPKLMFKLHGKHMERFSWRFEVESSLTKDALNEFVFPKINDYKIEKLDKNYLDYFRFHLRMKKKGHRIDQVYRFADLYILLSPSKHFFLTEEEFLAMDLSLHKWRKKEDKERICELESWKEKTFVSI